MHGAKYTEILNELLFFNYRYMTMTHGINGLTQQCIPFATDLNLTNDEKLERIAQCKMSVIMEECTVRSTQKY